MLVLICNDWLSRWYVNLTRMERSARVNVNISFYTAVTMSVDGVKPLSSLVEVTSIIPLLESLLKLGPEC